MNGIAYGVEKRSLTPTEAFKLIDLHPGLEDSIMHTRGIKIVGGSYLAAVHYIGTLTGYGTQADEFLTVFRTGFCDRLNDPARTARERLIRSKGEGRSLARSEQLEILTAA